jgi:peptide chain release factor
MKSPKKGGQHVNTCNSGVRAIYAPMELEALSYNERSQYLNKQNALKRLKEKVKILKVEKQAKDKKKEWKESKKLEKGNACKIFEGEDFHERK